ncbi:hypothetical protein LCGC14_1715590 [marine sediment metagenome]|uniref:Uncharacterized protein n=1 Tax=marine sediment metagenome TaxID=412755 RepID=A0A0F9KE05_9ZZZZ
MITKKDAKEAFKTFQEYKHTETQKIKLLKIIPAEHRWEVIEEYERKTK